VDRPRRPAAHVEGNDGGAERERHGGKSWDGAGVATAQSLPRTTTTNDFPYRVCGAQAGQLDAVRPSRKWPGGIEATGTPGGGESGYIAATHRPDVIFAGSYGGL
jgi:hypothetical protein